MWLFPARTRCSAVDQTNDTETQPKFKTKSNVIEQSRMTRWQWPCVSLQDANQLQKIFLLLLSEELCPDIKTYPDIMSLVNSPDEMQSDKSSDKDDSSFRQMQQIDNSTDYTRYNIQTYSVGDDTGVNIRHCHSKKKESDLM